jgi:ribonuclease-3
MMHDSSDLIRSLGHQFSDIELLDVALTHKSKGARNYERMEFLGDSLLGFVIADYLYHHFDGSDEGKLSRMRASVVRQETLATVARSLELGLALKLGEGELKSGGFERDSILSDVLEAIIGAIYLDGGFEPASSFVLRHFEPILRELDPATNYKDAKSRLQETLQARGLEFPAYEVVETTGGGHEQTFVVECSVNDLGKCLRASGPTRRAAEQTAAMALLEQIT